MKLVTTDNEGRPTGLYDPVVHTADSIPADAREISDEVYREIVEHQGRRRFDGDELVECEMAVREMDDRRAREMLDHQMRNDPLTAELLDLVADLGGLSPEEIRDRTMRRMGFPNG